jgi:hypothetical protein
MGWRAHELQSALAAAQEKVQSMQVQADSLRGERDTAAAQAAQAREQAAALQGRLQAAVEQNAALLARIAPGAVQRTDDS